MRIALLTEERYLDPAGADASPAGRAYQENILLEDALLTRALAAHGVQCTRLSWSDPRIDWSRFDAAIFRTTWDYFDRIEEFRLWLGQVTPHLPLLNSASIVRWNIDKHYLLDLERWGVRIVPTQVVERGERVILSERLAALGWEEGIAKPAISGAARHTWRARPGDPASDTRFSALIFEEDMLVQPFVPAVLDTGELSLMVLGGSYTHAVRKVPKQGDFRVQDDHGGTVHPHTATPDERAFAEEAVRVVSALYGELVYARVDIVNHDGPMLMELELIEPELWMRASPSSADVLASAVMRAVSGG